MCPIQDHHLLPPPYPILPLCTYPAYPVCRSAVPPPLPQMRMMEASWRAQLEASKRALQEAAAEKERLAAQSNTAAVQVGNGGLWGSRPSEAGLRGGLP